MVVGGEVGVRLACRVIGEFTVGVAIKPGAQAASPISRGKTNQARTGFNFTMPLCQSQRVPADILPGLQMFPFDAAGALVFHLELLGVCFNEAGWVAQ